MKKIFTFFLAGALISTLGIACGDNSGELESPPRQQAQNEMQVPESERDTYVTEYYRIVNNLTSDIVVELKSDDWKVFVIRPGEIHEIGTEEFRYESGIAYSRPQELVHASMKVCGEIIPEYIWWHEYWNRLREEGEDDYHYSEAYTLAVTEELLESVIQRQASITLVSTDYIIMNRTETEIVVKHSTGETATIKPGEDKVVQSTEAEIEKDLIESPFYGRILNAEMRINEEVVQYIWWSDHWTLLYEYRDDSSCRRTCTLTVTNELLEKLIYEEEGSNI